MDRTRPRLEVTDALRHAQSERSLPLIGREIEVARVIRLLSRQHHNNVLISGASGSGKTTFLRGVVNALAAGAPRSLPVPVLWISAEQIDVVMRSLPTQADAIAWLNQAFATLPASLVIIDQADQLLDQLDSDIHVGHVFAAFTHHPNRRLLLAVTDVSSLRDRFPRSIQDWEHIELNELETDDVTAVIGQHAPRLSRAYSVSIQPEVFAAVVEMSRQVPSNRVLPARALELLDEAAAAAVVEGHAVVDRALVQLVVSQRLGLPAPRLSADERQRLQILPTTLATHVHGQPRAVELVARTIQAAWLGLKNEHRPFGSFLFLGPSGVGKTEMAKTIAQQVYGSERAMLRLDMSEFAEAHTVHRLVGAPPGYVGYEAGGQLTSFIQRQPFSLILLDEIEKADPAIFDIFLQLLDDGRLTDGQGTTVDFTKSIIIATSNIGSQDIIAAAASGQAVSSTAWTKQYMIPLLLRRFRPEFINRFSAVTVFEPLSKATLLAIARREIEKIQARFQDRQIAISVSDAWLTQQIERLYDPLFGARPLKNFIEQTCEAVVAEQLLKQTSHD